MVWDLLVGAVRPIFDGLFALLPDAGDLGLSIPAGFIRGYAWLNSWLPVAETVAALVTLGVVILAILAFRVALTIWKALPFV
jgi:hypothetical protein